MPQQFVIVTVAEQRRLVRIEELREIVSLMALTEVEGRRGLWLRTLDRLGLGALVGWLGMRLGLRRPVALGL